MAASNPTLSGVIDNSPITPLHWKIWWLSAMGVFLDGFDLFVIGIALPIIVMQMHPGPALEGLVASAAVIGAMFGAIFGGRLTDRFGRRAIYVADLCLFVIFSVLVSFSSNVWEIFLFRVALGIGVGADYPICASYVSEFMPSRLRGRMLIGAFSFQALGMIAAALAGLLIIRLDPHPDAWRWMLGVGAVPAFLTLFLRMSVPESARWLIQNGRIEEAVGVISRLCHSSPEELAEPAEAERRHLLKERRKQEGYAVLFSSRYIKRTALTAGSWFLMDIAAYAVGIFTPTILAALAFGAHRNHGPLSADFAAAEGSAFLDLFLVAGFALNIWLVDKWGRTRLQIIGFSGMVLGLLLLAWASPVNSHGTQMLPLVFLGFTIFNLLINMGPAATTFILPAELFSTEVRASGHGFAAGTAKFGATIGIFFLPILKSFFGIPVTMLMLAAASLAGLLVTISFHVETSGRTLEELDPLEA